jgi:hypothetical protein
MSTTDQGGGKRRGDISGTNEQFIGRVQQANCASRSFIPHVTGD